MTANNITDGKVQTLPIKPLKTHAGEAGRRSSITSFDDMLKAQGRTKSTKTSAVKHLDYSADTSKLDRTGSSRTTSSASGTSTGQSQKTNRTVSTGSTSTKKTTSASSKNTEYPKVCLRQLPKQNLISMRGMCLVRGQWALCS